MKYRLSLKFFLNLEKGKGGLGKIYLRIVVNRKKAEIATSFSLAPEDWDDNRQRAKKANHINEKLSDMEKKIYRFQSLLEHEGRPVTARILKDLFLEKDKLDVYLIEFYSRFIAQVKSNPDLSNETISTYNQTYKHIENYIPAQFNIKDIPIKQVDYKFISSFDAYLQSQKLVRNTINKHHSRFRTLIIRAIKEGYITKNPYGDFALKNVRVNRVALTNEELQKLINQDLQGNESLQKVRDLFIFSTYTGLRYQDAQNLQVDQIHQSATGKPMIKMEQNKTKELISVPLLKPAIEILERYDNEEREITGKVLPRISNQKLNVYLKTIADLAGIKTKLTHHVARHTCATTVLLSNGIPMKAVSKWLGHTNIRQTEIYAKITDKYLEKIAEDVEEKIK